MCKIHYYLRCYYEDCDRYVGFADGMSAQCETALRSGGGRRFCDPQTVSTDPLPRRFPGHICHKCCLAMPSGDSEWPRARIVARSEKEKKALDDAVAIMHRQVAALSSRRDAATQT